LTTTLDLSPAARREIAEACERLALDYAHFADTGRWVEWAGLFAEDGELHLFGQVQKGREAIRSAVATGGETATLHCVSNIRIDVVGEREAAGTAYVAAFVKATSDAATASVVAPVAVGVYRDRYRLTADGWRIAQRAFEPFLMRG
jgi:hypothetical protein